MADQQKDTIFALGKVALIRLQHILIAKLKVKAQYAISVSLSDIVSRTIMHLEETAQQ